MSNRLIAGILFGSLSTATALLTTAKLTDPVIVATNGDHTHFYHWFWGHWAEVKYRIPSGAMCSPFGIRPLDKFAMERLYLRDDRQKPTILQPRLVPHELIPHLG